MIKENTVRRIIEKRGYSKYQIINRISMGKLIIKLIIN